MGKELLTEKEKEFIVDAKRGWKYMIGGGVFLFLLAVPLCLIEMKFQDMGLYRAAADIFAVGFFSLILGVVGGRLSKIIDKLMK